MDDDVGNHHSPVVAFDFVTEFIPQDVLHVKVHPLLQAAFAQQVHQEHLPEIALGLALAGNGVGQGTSLVANAAALLREDADHLFHGTAALGALLIGRFDMLAEFLEFFLDGFQQFAHALGAGFAKMLAVFSTEGLEGRPHLFQRLGRMLLFCLQHRLLGLLLDFQAAFQGRLLALKAGDFFLKDITPGFIVLHQGGILCRMAPFLQHQEDHRYDEQQQRYTE